MKYTLLGVVFCPVLSPIHACVHILQRVRSDMTPVISLSSTRQMQCTGTEIK
jgi:hypothetical protein